MFDSCQAHNKGENVFFPEISALLFLKNYCKILRYDTALKNRNRQLKILAQLLGVSRRQVLNWHKGFGACDVSFHHI